MSASATGDHPPASFPQKVVTSCGDIAELTYDSLDEGNRTSQAIDIVRRDDAGAVAVFLGTTRDNFEGKFRAIVYRLILYHYGNLIKYSFWMMLHRLCFRRLQ